MNRLWIVAIIVTSGCSQRVDQDERPPFRIDPTQPFRLEFGRGSGRQGLNTIQINKDGDVVLHRLKQRHPEAIWETATLHLQPDSLTEVLHEVESNGLMRLGRAYSTNIDDGIQWVFWVKQGDLEKSVYCNNDIPQQIRRFADRLDRILTRDGMDKVEWQLVPTSKSRQHEKELWKSIEHKKP